MALHVMDEANRCLQCKVPQCQKGCPINTNIPMAIRLLKENKLNEAGKMLFENNPLTTVSSAFTRTSVKVTVYLEERALLYIFLLLKIISQVHMPTR